jgi:prevent-host-death family protein
MREWQDASWQNALPLTEVKKTLSYLVDDLNAKGEEIVITKNGRPIVMLMGLDEVESSEETLAIQSDSEFMAEICKGLRSLKSASKLYTLEELLGD